MLLGKKTLGTIGVMSGIPFVHTEFCVSLAKMIQYNNEFVCQAGEVIHLATSDISFHMTARNHLAKETMGDWMLMLDTDHMFGPDLLGRMLLALNSYKVDGQPLDVITALYHYRTTPFAPVMYRKNDEDKLSPIVSWGDPRLFPIDACGAGSLLIRRSVFERIYNELHEEPFSIIPPYGEDNSFFIRLATLGIKAYCVPYIESLHLRTQAISSHDYIRTPELWEQVEDEAEVSRA